ncbi:MAG TPA: L,D-transpeptidase family protein [Hyphomicrobiaceae bacterium]|nr:L,D-transpeptidase family protein [Hyphomicrobiaceae bacterium]
MAMLLRPLAATILSLALIAAFAAPGWSQAKSKKPIAAIGFDAGPADGEGPDPLAPKEGPKKAPTAPGAPSRSAESKPAEEAHPVIVLVRQRLATPLAKGSAGEREDYAALASFYAEGNGQPVWTSRSGLTQRAKDGIAELRKADDWGLRAADYEVPVLDSAASFEMLADAEIRISLAVMKYGRHARGGRLDPGSVSRLFDQDPPVYDPRSLMAALAVADPVDAYLRRLHPQHAQFERLRQAMLAARGVKPEVNPAHVRVPSGPQLKPGQPHPDVAVLRQRLSVAAPAGGPADIFDDALADAVKAFQQQNGHKPTGIVTSATRSALNSALRPSGADPTSRLIINMERWRWMPENLGPFYVWDSVPEQMTKVYDNGKLVLAERIVVGKPETPTPMFSSDMLFVIFHPSWGVPPGMKANELLPQLRDAGGGFFGLFGGGASAVLEAHGLRVTRGGQPVNPNSVNWSSANIHQYEFVQPPGPKNVLGMVKFRFPNKHNVYMHDTPERHLFGGGLRTFSHGCMRVQNPVRFAEVLLARDKGWDSDAVAGYARRGGEIKLTTPIPVHVTYFTTTVDEDGKVQNWPDIYALDGRLASALGAGSVVTGAVTASSASDAGEPVVRPKARVKKKAPSEQSSDLFSGLFGN